MRSETMPEVDQARDRLREAIADLAAAQGADRPVVTDYLVMAATVSMTGTDGDGYVWDAPNAPHCTYGLAQILEAQLDEAELDDEDD